MRLLGKKVTVPTTRWDLVYLDGSLVADDRPDVNAVAPSVTDLLKEVRAERDSLEKAEDLVVLAKARRQRRDQAVDRLVVRLGGVTRATDKALYAQLFPKRSPSEIGKLSLTEQVTENERIVAELATLSASHPVRVDFEKPLAQALSALRTAMKDFEAAEVQLAMARTRLAQLRVKVDKVRVEAHGKLLTILGSRKEADSFFRPEKIAPSEEEEGEGEGEDEGEDASAEPPKPTTVAKPSEEAKPAKEAKEAKPSEEGKPAKETRPAETIKLSEAVRPSEAAAPAPAAG